MTRQASRAWQVFICSARESKIIIGECSKLASKCKQTKARKGEIDGSLMAVYSKLSSDRIQ
jgi:hypothetical protein